MTLTTIGWMLVVACFTFLWGMVTAIWQICRDIQRHGVCKIGLFAIVGRVQTFRPNVPPMPQPADFIFRCTCGGVGKPQQWDDPVVVAMMGQVEHTEACGWMKRKIDKTVDGMLQ